MKYAVWLMVLLLVVLHQDNWLWQDKRLVFGFIPIGLFYHACISMAATVTWYLATIFAWPDELADVEQEEACLLYTSPSPRDATLSRMPSSA